MKMSSALNLHQRLIQVMRSMGAVGKSGKANYGDRFEYHRIDDIDDKLRGALVEHGVVVVIVDIYNQSLVQYEEKDKYGNPRTTWKAECFVDIDLINVDDPKDKLCIVGWGQGLDYGDKATGKALSYAAKSAYLSAFHLRGQPDNEQDNIPSPPASAVKKTPQKAKLPDYDLVSPDTQEIINAIRQADCMTSLAALLPGIEAENEHMRKLVMPFFEDQKKSCWEAEINRCTTEDGLRAVGAEIAKDKNKELHAALQGVYATKLKSLRTQGQ